MAQDRCHMGIGYRVGDGRAGQRSKKEQGAAVYKPPCVGPAVWRPPLLEEDEHEHEGGRQPAGFNVSCAMFKPISLLLTGLLAAGPLLAQTEPNKSPATKDADKPPTVKEPAKKPADQSPPPAPGVS